MDKLRIYDQVSQVYIRAADRLTGSFFNDIDGTQAFPALSSGLYESQLALFIPGK